MDLYDKNDDEYIDWFNSLDKLTKTNYCKLLYNIYKNTKNINESIKIIDIYEKNKKLESEIENIKKENEQEVIKYERNIKKIEMEYEYKIIDMKNDYERKESDYIKKILKDNNDVVNGLLEEIKNLEIECEKNKLISLNDISKYKDIYKKDVEKEINAEYGEKINKLTKDNIELKIKNTELQIKYNNKLDNQDNFNNLKQDLEERLKILDNFGGFKKGYKMEDSVYDLLLHKYNYNNTMIKKVTSKNGCGDIELSINGIRYMFEVKAVSDQILEKDPGKIFDRFEKDSKNAYENDETDVSVFVSNGSSYIPGHGVLDLKKINTNKGPLVLIYVSDIINNPDRVDAVIRLGDIVYNFIKNNNDIDDFVGLFESVVIYINKFYENLIKDRNEREKRFREQDIIITEQIFPVIDKITKCLKKDSNEDIKNERLKDLVSELIVNNGYNNVTKKLICEEMRKRQIPQNIIKSFGGVRNLKIIVNKDIKIKKK
jgi:hypothetical protein